MSDRDCIRCGQEARYSINGIYQHKGECPVPVAEDFDGAMYMEGPPEIPGPDEGDDEDEEESEPEVEEVPKPRRRRKSE